MNVQVGTGFNTNTIRKDFYTYKGSNTDFLGFDNGFRALPSGFPNRSTFANLNNAQAAALGASLKNIWTADKNIAGVGYCATLHTIASPDYTEYEQALLGNNLQIHFFKKE